MNFMTSACLEVAVKLLDSATVKGFCCVEEKDRVEDRRKRVEERRKRKRGRYIIMCFFCFFITFSFLEKLGPSRLGPSRLRPSQNEYKSLYEFNLPVNASLIYMNEHMQCSGSRHFRGACARAGGVAGIHSCRHSRGSGNPEILKRFITKRFTSLRWGRFSFFIFNVNMKKKEFIRKRDHRHYFLEEIFHKW